MACFAGFINWILCIPVSVFLFLSPSLITGAFARKANFAMANGMPSLEPANHSIAQCRDSRTPL
jgi:hypothetical protein